MSLLLLDDPGNVVTVAEAYSVIPGVSQGQDDDLGAVIRDADSWIAQYLNWGTQGAGYTLERSLWQEYLSAPMGTDPRSIRLHFRPVDEIVEIADDAAWDWDGNVVAASAYSTAFLGKGEVALTYNSSHAWSTAKNAIRVQYYAGWTSDDLPPTLRRGVLMTIRHLWDLRRTQGAQNMSVQGRSQARRPEDLPKQVKQLVSGFALDEHGLF